MMITCRAPGKLYIAGEYAVVEPGHAAVLVAVDRFLTVSLTLAEHEGRIRSAAYPGGCLSWHRPEPDGLAHAEDNRVDYVLSAIRVVEALVLESGGHLHLFDLEVSSDLDDRHGLKLGLGSSAAVTVATVRAVCRFYDLSVGDEEVYKLAMLASDVVQPIGSGGDIAASTLSGWVSYTSPDRTWVRQARSRSTVGELLALPWPGLGLHRLTPPEHLHLEVGWTGAPASTATLVAGVNAGARSRDMVAYHRFLRGSQDCLRDLVGALTHGRTGSLASILARSRALLAGLSATSGIIIETALLSRFIAIAQQYGVGAKSSGAGGGDCGIALCPPGTELAAMRSSWLRNGITPLDLRVHTRLKEDS